MTELLEAKQLDIFSYLEANEEVFFCYDCGYRYESDKVTDKIIVVCPICSSTSGIFIQVVHE